LSRGVVQGQPASVIGDVAIGAKEEEGVNNGLVSQAGGLM